MKKIISAVLILSLILSSLCIQTIYASEFMSDDEKDRFVNNVRFLENIGVLNVDKRKNHDDTVTRAELAEILVRIRNLNENVATANIGFEDVQDGEQANYIAAAIDLGIMSAIGENIFGANNLVMYPDALSAMTRLLGYGFLVTEKGGYPNGVLSVSENIGLLKGLERNITYPITYNTLIKLIMNASTIDFMGKPLTMQKSGYQIMSGQTIMSEWWNLEEETGIVTENNFTSLTNTSSAPNGYIGIDGVLYKAYGDYNSLFGLRVKYYIDKKENLIVYIDSSGDKNNVVYVKADDIASFDNRDFAYYQGGSKRKVKLESSVDVIYNGEALTSYSREDLMPNNGDVTLIDNNDDNVYDVVIVKKYRSIVIHSVDSEHEVIYDMFNNGRSVDCGKFDSVLIKDCDGNRLELKELKQWDVLTVYEGKGNNVINIIVSRNHIEGKTNGTDEEEAEITIDNVVYDVDGEYVDFSDIKLNSYGTFYLNNENKVVAYRDISVEQYGYLISGRTRKEETLELKIFDSTGKMVKLKCAEKCKIDGVQLKEIDDMLSSLKKGEEEILPQLIQYKVNSDGEINYINTPYNNQPEKRELDNINAPYRTARPTENEKADSLRMTYASNGIEYRIEQKTFAGKIFISDDTLFFSIPQDIQTAEDDDFDVVDFTYFKSGDYYRFDSYANGEDPVNADVIVLVGMGSKARIGIVNSVREEARGDDVGYSIEVFSKYGKENLWVEDVDLVEKAKASNADDLNTYKIDRGDIILLRMNSQQVVRTINLMYDASSDGIAGVKMAANPSSTSFTANNKLIFGNVYSKYNGVISVTTNNLPSDNSSFNPTYQEAYNASKFSVYRCDKEENMKLETASMNDILDYIHCGQGYSKVAVITDNANPMLIVIYE